MNAEQLALICPQFSLWRGVEMCALQWLTYCFFLSTPRIGLLMVFLLPVCCSTSSVYILTVSQLPPHKTVTVLRENPFLFTHVITLLLFVIEPCCLVNGIVSEYNS